MNEKGGSPGGAGLRRVLTAGDAALLATGIVVGTGIFAVPGQVARSLGAPGPILLAWAAGGAVALAGALTYCELASRFPRQGGAFVYVLRAFGPFAAFFKGWGAFLVGFPASGAVVATIFGTYLAAGFGAGPGAARGAAFAGALAVWLLNLRGTRFSATLQNAFTLAKLVALGVLGALVTWRGNADWTRLAVGGAWPPLPAFLSALVGVLWTYDGWANLTVVAGEMADPRRGVVRALLLTVGVVTALYLWLNVVYLAVLPLGVLSASDSAASAVATAALGDAGGRIVAALVAVSAFGTLFGIAISGPRYAWAMADAGLFFRRFGAVDPATSAPRAGATAWFAATCAYLATGTFGDILGFYVAIHGLYVALSLAAVYRVRALDPEAACFRVPGFPVVPALAIAAMLGVTVSEIVRAPLRTGAGLGILLLSLPAYRWWRRFGVAASRGVR